MPKIKLHVFRGTNNGTESCDYRGDKFIGHEQGDEHRTVAEIDNASEDAVTLALADGLIANKTFASLMAAEPAFAAPVATALGLDGDGPVGLRIGVWDE